MTELVLSRDSCFVFTNKGCCFVRLRGVPENRQIKQLALGWTACLLSIVFVFKVTLWFDYELIVNRTNPGLEWAFNQ